MEKQKLRNHIINKRTLNQIPTNSENPLRSELYFIFVTKTKIK